MTVIDVGANVGLYTALALADRSFRGNIIAVEPDEESRRFLNETIRLNASPHETARVRVLPLAISDAPGSLPLFRNPNNKGDNRLFPDPSVLESAAVVPVNTLDHLVETLKIGGPVFPKMDTQGAEAKVIAGAKKLLERTHDCILLSEFWPYGLMRAGSDPGDHLRFLLILGFDLCQLGEKSGEPTPILDTDRWLAAIKGRTYANVIGLKGRFPAPPTTPSTNKSVPPAR